MKTLTGFTLAIGIAFCIGACGGPTEPEESPFQFPFGVGNQWTYEYTIVTDFDEPKTDDTLRLTIVVSIAQADTILPGICAYEFHERTSEMSDDDPPGVEAYLDLPSGMYSYYTCNPGQSENLPKAGPSAPGLRVGLLTFENARDLAYALTRGDIVSASIMDDPCYQKSLRDPPTLVLPYPQVVGDEWLITDSVGEIDLRVQKRITGRELRTTPAGSFECYAVEAATTFGSIGPLTTVDYYAKQGLIERESIVYDIPYQAYEFPYGAPDTVDLIFSNRLTSFSIVSH